MIEIKASARNIEELIKVLNKQLVPYNLYIRRCNHLESAAKRRENKYRNFIKKFKKIYAEHENEIRTKKDLIRIARTNHYYLTTYKDRILNDLKADGFDISELEKII